MWWIVYKNNNNISHQMQACMEYDFVVPLHQEVKCVYPLPPLNLDDHVITFGQWNISKHHTWEIFEKAYALGLDLSCC